MTRINEKSTRTPAMRGTNPGTGHDNVLSTIPLHISPERERKQLFGDLKAVDRVLISKNVEIRKRRAVFAIDDPDIYEVFHKTNTVNDTNDGYGSTLKSLQKMARGYNNWRNGIVDARRAPKPESLGNPTPETHGIISASPSGQVVGPRNQGKSKSPSPLPATSNSDNLRYKPYPSLESNTQSLRPYPGPGNYRPYPATNPLQGPIGGLDPRQIPSGINVTYGFGVNQRQSTLPNPPRIDQQAPTPSDSQQVNRRQQPAIPRPVLPMPDESNMSQVKQALRTNIDIAVPIDSHEAPYKRVFRLKEVFGPGAPAEGSFHTFLLHPEKTQLGTLKKMVAAWNDNVADHPAPTTDQHPGRGAPHINLDSNEIQVANVPQRRSDSGPLIVQWAPPRGPDSEPLIIQWAPPGNDNVADHPAPTTDQHPGRGAPHINLDSNEIQVADVPQRRSDSGPFIVQWTQPWNVNDQDPPPVSGTNKMDLNNILNPNR